MSKPITQTVWILSLVSLLTDTASEMLYPVMPLYLKSIGFSILLIGILEGAAEATAGLSKGYFGKLSDSTGKRMPFVQIGYALSAISKPLMAVSIVPVWLFFVRTVDRLGKGLRTGARDAVLSAEATADHCASSAGVNEIDIAKYHIPAMIYNIPEQKPETISTMCSQIRNSATSKRIVLLYKAHSEKWKFTNTIKLKMSSNP